MDVSYCSDLQLQESSFLFESLLDKPCDPLGFDLTVDPGYFSAGSSLSPTSSVDSFSFSPTCPQSSGNQPDPLACFVFNSCPAAPQQLTTSSRSSTTTTTTPAKKSRSRYPGKKRQTASEREKLRMRDLTKAMHHLRTYLPPSVAPAGQTLTKIETLRLTIRYISYLSAQLGISEESLEQRRSSESFQPQTLSQFLGHPEFRPQQPQQTALQTSYQVPGGVCFSSDQCWTPQQQQLQMHSASF